MQFSIRNVLWTPLVLAMFVFAAGVLPLQAATVYPAGETFDAEVTGITNEGKLELKDTTHNSNITIYLWGIDFPPPATPGNSESIAAFKAMLPEKTVVRCRIVKYLYCDVIIPTTAKGSDREAKMRVRWTNPISFTSTPGSLWINGELAKKGWVWVRNEADDRLQAWQWGARSAKTGIWQNANLVTPKEWRKGRNMPEYDTATK